MKISMTINHVIQPRAKLEFASKWQTVKRFDVLFNESVGLNNGSYTENIKNGSERMRPIAHIESIVVSVNVSLNIS